MSTHSSTPSRLDKTGFRLRWRAKLEPYPAPIRAAGFTLIELSIVLVIVALLAGGILVGQDLLLVAKARGAMTELQQVETSIQTFRLKYNCLPGDCKKASSLGLGNNGNGDKALSAQNVPGTNNLITCGDATLRNFAGQSCVAPTMSRTNAEIQQSWVHLSNAELLEEDITTMNSPYNIQDGWFKKFKNSTNKTYVLMFTWGNRTYLHTGLGALNTTYSHGQFPTASLRGSQARYITEKLGYELIDNPGCTGYGTCTYPPALLAGQKVIASGVNASFSHALYLNPSWASCATNSGGTLRYNDNGGCHLIWQVW